MCSMCRRKVGLWNYSTAGSTVTSDSQNGHAIQPNRDGSGDQEPPNKLRKISPQDKLDPISSHHLWCPWNALRKPSEDVLSASFTVGSSPQSSASPSSPGDMASPGDGGDVGARKVPAWVMVAQIVAPGLLSQSRRLVQQVKQGSMTDGLRCIRRVLNTWSSPEKGTPTSL